MSKPSATRQCDIFTRGSKSSKPAKPTTPSSPLSNADASMVNITEVLNELKALRSDFGTKLDNINTGLTGMANALTALEGKVTEIKQDVSTNTARVEEAETRIDQAERSMEKVETALESATKRITFLEAKTDDLENRGGSRGRTNSPQLLPTCCQNGWDYHQEKLLHWSGFIAHWPTGNRIKTERCWFAF